MRSSTLFMLIAVGGLLLVGGTALVMSGRPLAGEGGSVLEYLGAAWGTPTATPPPAASTVAPEPDAATAGAEPSERYTDPTYGFSFEIPEGAGVKSFSDERGDVALIEGPSAGSQAPPSFQIFISPFDEPFDPTQGKPSPITLDRIKQDLPNLAIRNLRRATLAGIPALVFETADPSLGNLHEVWFVQDGQLYQITAQAEFEGQLSELLATWRFP